MPNTSIRDAAFAYRREFDWCTIPLCPPDHAGCTAKHIENCESPGKRPWPKWKRYQDELITTDQLGRLFKLNPQSNVGLILGPVSKLVRVDVDGIHGAELLKIKSGRDLPDTNEFTSGSSGRGLLYRIPEGIIVATTSAKGDGEHQELRFQAKGAQTVLPPSIHPDGRVYSWTAGRSPWDISAAFAPAWLLEELAPKNKKPNASPPTEGSEYNASAEPTFPDASKIPLAREALAALKSSRAANYDEWIDVGMALHSVDDSLLSDWIQFSRSCPEKFKEGECSVKWSTFTRSGKVTLGTLIHMAEQDGWLPPWKRTSNARSASATPAPGWRAMPIGVLPTIVHRYVSESAAAIDCDPSMVAVPLLAVLAAAIGATRSVLVRESWFEPSVLWTAVVADSGSAKSPALDAATQDIVRRQRDAYREYERAMRDHETALLSFDVELADWKKNKGMGSPPEKPVEPICPAVFVTDITPKALATRFKQNPRGLLLRLDELTAWLKSFGRYTGGRGSDREAYLSMYRAAFPED